MRIKSLTYLTYSSLNPEFKVLDKMAGITDVICILNSFKVNLTKTLQKFDMSFYLDFAKIHAKTKYTIDTMLASLDFSESFHPIQFGDFKYIVTSKFFKTKKFNKKSDVDKFLKRKFEQFVLKILKIRKWKIVEKKFKIPFGEINRKAHYDGTSPDSLMGISYGITINRPFSNDTYESFYTSEKEANKALQKKFEKFKDELTTINQY